MTTYFTVNYDNEASGPFVAEGANLTWTASSGFVVTVIDNGTTGTLKCALISGTIPTDGLVLTQGGTTADADGNGEALLYPAYFREDVQVANTGAITWTGPALGATHSFFFDGQTVNVVAGEILTFSGGQTCEVITVESDAGASGELSVRFISALDLGLPADNDTFTGDIAGDGTLDGVIHPRAYQPLELHRLLGDLNDDSDVAGNDDLSMIDPTPTDRSTDQIIALLGNVNINDTVAQHMYGGSIDQAGGDTQYSGVDVQVTSPNSDTQPVLILDDTIVTDYWKNAYMPDSIAGNVRLMVKTREDGANIDGKRITGKLLEFGDSYFIGSTTLGQATTALALFSSTDGNNQTAVGTVAGAPYNTIVQVEGYQDIDYNNGNGLTPFGYEFDIGSATKAQAYERTKYIQRRGTAENLFGRNAQLFTGFNTNFAYDAESANFTEPEVIYWGTEITYSAQTVNLTIGEVITFSPSGAIGRLLYDNDGGATGTLIIDLASGTPTAADTMTGVTSGGDGDVDTVVVNSTAGSMLLMALDDDGTAGNMYGQRLTGLLPVNDQTVFGGTSNQTADVNGTVASRTINNQYIGVFTGSDFQTNFGIALDPSDAQVNDQLRNLLDVVQQPPNNQTGTVAGLVAGDAVTAYPWDGSTLDVNGDPEPDFNQMTLAVALTSGVSTVVDVGTGNIPDNTPAAGFLRIERDSDGNYGLVEYSSHDGDDEFTLVGTSPVTAAISNNVFVAYIDTTTATTQETFTSVFGPGSQQIAITVRRGGVAPIKTFKTSATFGASGFSVTANRISDA